MPAYKYKTKDGKQFWYASFTYQDWRGDWHRKVKRGFVTKKEALEFEYAFKDHGRKDADILFPTLVKEYMKDCETRLKPTTYATKKAILDKKILPYFQKLKIKDVDARTIRNWQNEILNNDEDYSETYLRTIHAQMSAIMNYAVKYYHLPQNPCHLAGTIGKTKADEMKIWSRETFEKFISYEKRTSFRIAFQILYYTGMREGELLALTPEDILDGQIAISVNKNYAVVDDVPMFLTPKTEKSQRIIEIDKYLYNDIKSFVQSLNIPKDDRIFYFGKNGLIKEFHRISEQAGVEQIRIHDLRHSHVALLIKMGVPITEISKRLGHESPKTTLDVYSHLYPGAERNVATILENLRAPENGSGSDEPEPKKADF